ncbi:MAG: hypothetical protein RMI49_02400 [Candidatus Caldarchaeum sp.]|nr:hypothetical protein [Candidatus Caldarchaeum sp.]
MKCEVCGEPIPYVLLRLDLPRCPKGHELGVWVACGNSDESHVYLRKGLARCPYCGNDSYRLMSKGMRVKCLHTGPAGPCAYPDYVWLEDGPPCHLNHLTKIAVVKQ